MDAYDFAREAGTNNEYSFGMDKAKTVAALRNLADALEAGRFILQSGGIYTQARIEDFVMTVLNLKFTERRTKKLYGSESPIAEAVQPL